MSSSDTVMVPREPTEAMLEQATESLIAQYDANGDWDDAKDVIEKLDAGALYAAMLAASPQQSPISGEGWQDISTAPEDGTWILCHWRHLPEPVVCRYRPKVGRWAARVFGGSHAANMAPGAIPGHWMPLPAPPVPSVLVGEG